GRVMKRHGSVPVRGRYRQETGSLPMGQQEIIISSLGYFSQMFGTVLMGQGRMKQAANYRFAELGIYQN
ncbi:hypothetical protein VUS93_32930, partial [Pseudomonas aeruginosa]